MGRTFTAGGSFIDTANGRIFGYVRRDQAGGFDLTTWDGSYIMELRLKGRTRGFQGTPLLCFAGEYEGKRYHGRGLGEGVCLRLRAGRAV